MKGFTLVELIFVIAIMGVLTSIVVSSMNTSRIKKEQDQIVQTLAVHLEKQKADTQAGKDGAVYGVKISPDSYVLYKGTSFSPSAPTNTEITLPSDYQIEETLTNANNLINFSRLTGDANEVATLTIRHIENKVTPQQIVISKNGSISVIE